MQIIKIYHNNNGQSKVVSLMQSNSLYHKVLHRFDEDGIEERFTRVCKDVNVEQRQLWSADTATWDHRLWLIVQLHWTEGVIYGELVFRNICAVEVVEIAIKSHVCRCTFLATYNIACGYHDAATFIDQCSSMWAGIVCTTLYGHLPIQLKIQRYLPWEYTIVVCSPRSEDHRLR